MNSKILIIVLIIAGFVWAGFKIAVYYKEVAAQEQMEQEAASGKNIEPTQLRGMSPRLEASLRRAQQGGLVSFGNWLATNSPSLQDPRKAWIQLDYCSLLAREDPQKARELYLNVKERTDEDSPVYPRVMQLQKSFE